ncbi:MAG: polysaccharide deacetylase family protein [Bacteroidales bacterium]
MKPKKLLIIIGICVVLAAGVLLTLRLTRSNTKGGQELFRVPRVLIITTGKDGTGTLPEGVILTMESFISHGAYTRINTRDALLDNEYLAQFDILLLLTAIEYHDADRQYSLTYMEDIELEIISNWVQQGGVLIAGDNTGRNLRNGADRISIHGRLEPDNWPLSQVFGVMMSERNMEGFALVGDIADTLRGELIPPLAPGAWILVPDSILNENAIVLASWQNDSMKFPSLIMNPFGKGISFLLPSSYLLHPSNEGGHWNAMQINAFCELVLDQYYKRTPVRIGIHPWPNGHPAAFAVSLNSDGDLGNYRRTFKLLSQKSVSATLFVNGALDQDIVSMLNAYPHQLQSNGWKKTNMRDLSFSETVLQLEMNEQSWNRNFSGFRFPYTLNSVWGMDFLQRKGYSYDSSIGIDHTHSFAGSLFPYHLPVFQGENYQVLDLLEVGPVARDDYFYFRMIQESPVIDLVKIYENSLLFDEYLKNFWKDIAEPIGGMMIYLGHPLFSGHNDTTLIPLSNLIDTARKDGAWITSMDDIANRWEILDDIELRVYTAKLEKKEYTVEISMPEGTKIEGLTLRISQKPLNVKASEGKAVVKQENNHWLIITDGFDGQRITFSLK